MNTREAALKLFQKPSTILNNLKENQITEKDSFHFLLGYAILYNFVGVQGLFSVLQTLSSAPGYALLYLAQITLLFAEINTCFRINARKDNRNFLTRFTCLGFSVSLRYLTCYFFLQYIFIGLLKPIPILAPLLIWAITLMPLAVSILTYRKMRSLFLALANTLN